jgi:hypothetical protein
MRIVASHAPLLLVVRRQRSQRESGTVVGVRTLFTTRGAVYEGKSVVLEMAIGG